MINVRRMLIVLFLATTHQAQASHASKFSKLFKYFRNYAGSHVTSMHGFGDGRELIKRTRGLSGDMGYVANLGDVDYGTLSLLPRYHFDPSRMDGTNLDLIRFAINKTNDSVVAFATASRPTMKPTGQSTQELFIYFGIRSNESTSLTNGFSIGRDLVNTFNRSIERDVDLVRAAINKNLDGLRDQYPLLFSSMQEIDQKFVVHVTSSEALPVHGRFLKIEIEDMDAKIFADLLEAIASAVENVAIK